MGFKKKVKKFKRRTWIPLVEEGDTGLTNSKYAGKPWLAKQESWPTCSRCKKPMHFFLQLNLTELSKKFKENFGDGLFQLFYCTNLDCEVEFASSQPFTQGKIVRVVQLEEENNNIKIPQFESPIRAKTIVDWDEKEDLPDFSEAEDILKIKFDGDDGKDYEEYETLNIPIRGDKLSGWPFWIQWPAYPYCRKCEKPMKLLYQIFSGIIEGSNLQYDFGDAGVGYVMQCEEHKEFVTFHWDTS